jgi:hypothetical protein
VGNALAVRLVQGIGNLNRVLQDLLNRQRTFLQSLRERLAFEILHHQEISPVLVAGVEEDTDVGMV